MPTQLDYFLNLDIPTIETAATGAAYVVAPDAGEIIKISGVCVDAVDVATVVTTSIDGTDVTGGLTMAVALAGGAESNGYPTALNDVLEGSVIKVLSGEQATSGGICRITLTIRRYDS